MCVLSDRDIDKRLLDFKEIGLDISVEEAVKRVGKKKIPGKLEQALKKGRIIISPFPDLEDRLGPDSLDLRLGNTIRIPKSSIGLEKLEDYTMEQIIDVSEPETLTNQEDEKVVLEEDEKFVLHPRRFIQATTYEIIMVPVDLRAYITGRSKFGRFGLSSTSDAPKIDPGFIGRPVLEIPHMGVSPFALFLGLLFCQITFHQLSSPCRNPYYEVGTVSLGQLSPFHES